MAGIASGSDRVRASSVSMCAWTKPPRLLRLRSACPRGARAASSFSRQAAASSSAFCQAGSSSAAIPGSRRRTSRSNARAWVRWRSRATPGCTSGWFISAASCTGSIPSTASFIANRISTPGGDCSSGCPVVSSGTMAKLDNAAVTRRASAASGVTSATVLAGSSMAVRIAIAMAVASSCGDCASSRVRPAVASGTSAANWCCALCQ